MECEARTVLSWPLTQRRAYLTLVDKRRGPSGRTALEAAITRLWRVRAPVGPTPLEDGEGAGGDLFTMTNGL